MLKANGSVSSPHLGPAVLDPPTGTITFLFTDIEGSTRLWETQPDPMRGALARHDRLLRAAIEANGGRVFKTIGDAFCVAFPTAESAVRVALAAQLALPPESETEPALHVRMAIHTGAAELRDNDYFGTALSRVSRLLATAHGGQVVLSGTAEALVRDDLPRDADLRPLGSHRLRDLDRREQVYQLLHPDLRSDFPPLRSLDTLPNNLPQQVTSFIGRAKELAEVKRLLTTTRLLTVTGAGGTGKSRLTVHAAAELLDEYEDGVWLVGLAPVPHADQVPLAVAGALGLKDEPGRPTTEALLQYLNRQSLLLLLDNCEHVLDAAAALADRVLRHCPHVKILASSQHALNIPGETTYRLPSLSVPNPEDLPPLESLTQYEAVKLFIDRAAAAVPEFAVTSRNAPAVAQVCHRLDGIALAIELAAARVRVLTPEKIAERLDDRFRLLTGGARTALPRQQTLRALIDWSYDLLTHPERLLLRRLSAFVGGWTLEASEAVCPGEGIDEWEVLDLLSGLVDKSLVIHQDDPAGDRYHLLETVRQYAAERLVEAGEAEWVKDAHLEWCAALVESARGQWRGPEQASVLRQMETDHDNLRAALRWSVTSLARVLRGARIAGPLGWFWLLRGHLTEGRYHLERLLTCVGDALPPRVHANLLNSAGMLAGAQGDYAQERAVYEQVLALQRRAGDRDAVAGALNNVALAALNLEDFDTGRVCLEEAVAMLRHTRAVGRLALSLGNLAGVNAEQGDWDAARPLYEEALTLMRRAGDRWGESRVLAGLAEGDLERGALAGARAHLTESLRISAELQDRQYVDTGLWLAARVFCRQGEPGRGLRLLACSHANRERLEIAIPQRDARRMEQETAACRTALGEVAFADAWAAGAAMSPEQAITEALAGLAGS